MKERIAAAVLTYFKRIFITFDQAVNVILLFGREDETISARCWRLRHVLPWGIARRVIDRVALFFKDKNHCEESYRSELEGKQLPKEYREAEK